MSAVPNEALLARLRQLPPEKRAALLARLQTAETPETPEIPRLGRVDDVPLSYAQERLWFLEQLDPGLPVYNIPLAVRLHGRLDRSALGRALRAVVARHEVLRTRFADFAGRPVQRIVALAEIPLPLPLVDLRSGGTGAARERAARRLMEEEAGRPFDFRRGPLLRARLLWLEETEHLLLLTLHHIAGDVWSLGVLLRELAALYAGETLAAPPIQYADYALWQRGWLDGEALAAQLDYWRRQLAGVPALQLPADRRRPATPSQQGGQVPIDLSPAVTEALRQIGRTAGATLFMVLLAGFEVVLARWSGQDDFAVGTAVANRERRELEGLIGFFVNLLALRAGISGDLTFRQLLARVREVTLGAFAHQDLPFERLVEELRPARDAGFAPLVQATFQLQNAPFPSLRVPGLTIASVPVETRTAKFDLGATLAEHAGGLAGSLEYSADLFAAATVTRFAGHLRRLYESAAADPEGRIGELPLLDERERRQVVVEWNRTAVDWGPVRPAHELFREQAERTPEAVAVVAGADGERCLSYGELDRQAGRLARHLRTLGVGPEVRVGLCLPRGPELLIGIFGVLQAGGAYVPLDPSYPLERLAFMIEDAAPRVVLVASRHRELIAGAPVLGVEEGSPLEDGPPAPESPAVDPENAAYVIYTSGSTGRPKGVVVPHRGLFHSIQEDGARWLEHRPRRVLQFSSPSFDASVSEFFHALAWGGALVNGAPGPLFPGPELVRLLRDQAVEVASLAPSVLAQLDPADVPGLAVVIASSEALPAEIVARWAPGRRLWNAYGPTECTIGSTTSDCTPEKLPPPIGVPIQNARAYVLEPGGEPAPVGVPGELHIGGQGVTRGYLGRSERTAERFVPDPFGPPGSRLYRTGDRVRWRLDGELDFLGRIDHQIKLRGFRVEPGEIEAALRQAPGVRDAVALLREDVPGDPRLVGYVTEAAAPRPAGAEGGIELWPSVAEYFVYDEALYYALTHDHPRNERYRGALGDLSGRTVLDVGTGADLVLARLCLEAGARRVYAVEKVERTFRRAQATVERLGIGDRCTLLHGDVLAIELPEPVDVCVSEIVGPIGGCEGAAPILDAARRWLKAGGRMVPEASVTRIAAVSLPDRFLAAPRFVSEAVPYVERIFAEVGHPFDLRLCVKGFPPSCLISDPGIFEDLDFTRPVLPAAPASRHDVELTIDRAARLDGFVLWLYLRLGGGQEIDVLEGGYAWLPVYLPAFARGIQVEAGDRILATVSSAPSDNGVNPDYRISGALLRQRGEPMPFDLDLPHHPPAGRSYRATPFYERLWAGFATGSPARGRQLREHLARQLPAYLVPSVIVVLPELPLLPNGKLDRSALPAPDPERRAAGSFAAPRSPLEEILAGLWAEVLGVERVSVEDDFFTDLGGHSLLATQVISRLRDRVGIELPLRSLFEASTVRRWAALALQATPKAAPDGGEIRRRAWGAAAPLSYAQERLWFIEQLTPGLPVYNLPLAVRIAGRLDAAALGDALRAPVERHEALRARFGATAGRPVQEIAAPGELSVPLPVIDLQGIGERQEREMERLAAAEAARPFDLARGPLLRARLLRLGETEHLLFLTLHHIVSDGWSLGVLVAELGALYAGQTLPERAIQYADYAVWQREWLTGEVLAAEIEHWRQRLEGVPALQLPTDRRRPAVPSHRGGRVPVEIPPAQTEALRRLCRGAGTTLFMTLFAGFAAVLARYTGEDDVAIGTVVANRRRRELEGLIGFFVNTLVLRTDLSGEPSFSALLGQVRQVTLDAYSHQDVPFERLVEELRPERDGSRPPLVQALFALENTPLSRRALPGLTLTPLETASGTAKFDLAALMAEVAEGVAGVLEYAAELFEAATIARLAGHFLRFLDAAVADPEQRVGELPMLGEEERRQLLVEWNQTAVDCGEERPAHALVEAWAQRTPDAPALFAGDLVLSYGELNRRANRLAHHLMARGVGPEERVGLRLERGVDLVVSILAVGKAGGVYVPLDPAYPAERLAFMIEDAAPRVVLEAGEREDLAAFSDRNPPPRATLDNGAYVIYTSGSTGRPKGALVSHRSLFHLLQAIARRWDLARPRRMLQFSSPSFDASVGEIFGTLPWGGALVLGTRDQLLPTPELAALCLQGAVDTAILPPSLLALLDPADFPGLETLIAAGEALPAEVAARWSVPAGRRRMWNGYGPTECTVFSTTADCTGWSLPTIGRPIANVRAYVLERGLTPAPVGVPGELYIGGPGLARGYLNRPELTAERFVPDPFGGSGALGLRLYRSGDRVRYLPGGEIEYLGRLDHQVKLRGFRIELGEIESVLREAPDVREAVVLLRWDPPGDPRLVAYVVPAGEAPAASELRHYCEERLPEHMVPAAFAVLPELPLSPNGKLDRRRLPAPPLLHALEGLGRGDGFVAPDGPLEELLAGAWAEVLGLDQVSAEDDFFADLGGHSLLATQVVARVRSLLGREVPLRSLFDASTVRDWAVALEAPWPAEAGLLEAEISRCALTTAPLSFAQERLWFLEQLTPGLAVYNVPLPVRLAGRLDPAALGRALRVLVERHEVLRTRFRAASGEPVQEVVPAGDFAFFLPRVDLSGLAAREGEAARLAAEEAARPFDLGRAPLVRARLLRLASEEHLLLLTFHHIASDGWSLGVALSEIAALYVGEPLPELPIQYADYALWQRGALQGEVLARQLDYWRERLAGLPPLELPVDRPRPAVRQHHGGWVGVELPADLSESLRRLGREAGATLFMTLLAGFSAVLARYGGQDDLAVGTAVANRRRRELECLIGFFVNTLVLRADLSGRPSFGALLARLREVTLGAYGHQDLPFERLVEALKPERETGRNPLVQVMLVLQNTPLPRLTLPGIELAGVPVENRTAKLDLTLSLAERDDGRIGGVLEHDADLFTAATAARLAGHLARLLAAAVAHPDRPVEELPLLDAEERRQLLIEPNRTAVEWGPVAEHGVHGLFTAQAARTPEATAIIFGDLRLSYAELDRRSARLARRLQALGVGPEALVGVRLERSADLVIALLGVLRSGGAYVPLDPDLPPARLAAMEEDAGLAAIVTEDTLGMGDLGTGTAGAPESRTMAESAVYAIYTSGSTGKPKGVVNTHGGVVNRLLWMQAAYRLSAADRVLQKTPYSFDVSVWEFFWPLVVGAALVVARPGGHRDPEYLAELIDAERVTVSHFVPSMLAAFLAAQGMARCSSLRQVFASGEALSDELRRRFFAQSFASGAELHNLYGPTEAAVDVTAWPCAPGEAAGIAVPSVVPIGRPIANLQIYVLDATMEPMPAGVPGELYIGGIGGIGLARGYLNRPDLTAERFVPDPFANGERLYRTGDRARFQGGAFEYLGRLDQQIKLRGFRIELGEIEAVLAASPGVREALVQLREDVPGDPRLVAYVTPENLDVAELRLRCGQRLPAAMVPSAFVLLPQLPLLPNGKVDRRALPAPEEGATPAGRFVAPADPLEEILAGIWGEVLGRSRVSVADGFFTDLGGHSLLATQVVSRVRERLGLDLPLRSLFEAPTVRSWATLARAGSPASAIPRIGRRPPAAADRDLPLSYSQERLWFLEQLMPGLAVYNLPLAVRLSGRLDPAVLGRALARVVLRHEVLRTGFRTEDGRPVQAIVPAGEVPVSLPLIDLRPLQERDGEAARLAAEEARRLFDLRRGPLLRGRLLRLEDEEHLLLLTLHHIASDGWSLGVLVRELSALYRGETLPDLPVQYADYAVWQRGWLQGEVLAAQMEHWRGRLTGVPVLELPTDRPRPAVSRHRGAQVRTLLPADLAAALQRESREAGVTLFMILLSGFAALLARYSGQEDFAVGTAVANRRHRELEGLIGFFVNTLALRTDLSGARSFGQLLTQVREVALGAYEHQDLPFERLVAELRPVRDTSHEPLVQVSFLLQNAPMPDLHLPGLALSMVPVESRTAKFDLLVSATEYEDGVAMVWEYDADLFDAATIERMAGHQERLLIAALTEPQSRVAALPLLSEAERLEVLDLANGAPAAIPDLPVHALFEAQAAKTPEAVALVHRDLALTYADLDRRAGRLARHLRASGVGPDIRVGLRLERGPDLVIGILGVLKAGGAYVPLDPSYPAERLAFMIEDAAPRVVLDAISEGDPAAEDGPALPAMSARSALPENAAYVLFTSGSTGRPKGVALPHRGLLNLIAWQLRTTPQPARTLQLAPASFDVSFQEILSTLGGGGMLVLLDEETRRDPHALLRLLDRERVERLFLPMTALQQLAQASTSAGFAPGALREVLTAGERLQVTAEVAALFLSLPGCTLHNQYGPTESHVVTAETLGGDASAWPAAPPIGRPLDNVAIHVLDGEMAQLPSGVPGELYIGGMALARGYLDRPELTAERFVPDPFGGPGAWGGRLYRTGDRARFRAGGEIEYLGRVDQQVKLRGYRIEPGEIEAVLAGCSGVREAAVTVREDRPGDPRLVAYLVPEEGAPAPAVPDLRRRCQEVLPAFMVPSSFVVLERLPLLPSGKLDRRSLAAVTPANTARPELSARYVAPQNQLERAVAEVWREVLDVERVGIHDNFFDLGGHSLLAVRLHGRLQEKLGRDCSVIDVFRFPTVESFARFLAEG
ncbi:MAG TPA: amino acid adenylation domain-containing protein, partial [Thermoanaerobaculia bacterium]|nr:amino acid adenylation domain-containing protein [Thermoanaerobaculia bacterium]